MRAWAFLLAGLAVWAAHFFALYAVAGILPARPTSVAGLVFAVTALAVAADGAILWRARIGTRGADRVDRWVARLASLTAAISLLAVIWQAAPAIVA